MSSARSIWLEPLAMKEGIHIYAQKMIVHALISLCDSRRGHWRPASLEVLCAMRNHHILWRHLGVEEIYNCEACQLRAFFTTMRHVSLDKFYIYEACHLISFLQLCGMLS